MRMSKLSKPETRISRQRHEISRGNLRVVKRRLALGAKVCRRRAIKHLESHPSYLGCFVRVSSIEE